MSTSVKIKVGGTNTEYTMVCSEQILFSVKYQIRGTTHVHYNAPMQGGHNKKEGAERSAKKQMII